MSRCSKCDFEPPDPRARFCPECGAMLEGPKDPADPLIGRVVGDRYRVIGVIGQGGMGRVYLAEQKMGTVSRKVALKTLHADLAADAATARRFNREAETVIQLQHPNTITFHDFGQTAEGTLYIVMEHIEGESLGHVIKRGPLAPERVERILAQVCSSLHEAHEAGVIHRDLKPENIFLTERAGETDFVKVLDFGIAKRTELDTDSLKLTRAGFVLGTPPYMSPEQFAGYKLDRRTDIYSLGVLTYEMLTGRLPWKATTPWEWATQHMSAEPAPMDTGASGALVPESCRRAVMRALAKSPDARPPTARAFFEEFSGRGAAPPLVANAETAPATHLPPPGVGIDAPAAAGPRAEERWDEPAPRWRRRRGAVAVVIALAAIATGAGAGFVLISLDAVPEGPWSSWTATADGGSDAGPGFVDRGGGSPSSADARAALPRPIDGGAGTSSPTVDAAVAQLRAALGRGDVDEALDQLPVVEQLAGRRSAAAAEARDLVAAAVAEEVGRAVGRRDCLRASEVYRKAQSVSAHRDARGQFGDGRCPLPE